MPPTKIDGIPYAAPPRAAGLASTLAWPPRLVVIHDTGNNTSTAAGEARYAATRTDSSSRWTSAHAYIDPHGPLGSLPLNLRAWAAKSYGNQHGFHLEMCRTAAGVDPATRYHTANVTRWLCQQAGIPMVKLSPTDLRIGRRGIVGHLDFTLAGIDENDHRDPGDQFDWAGFMAMVIGPQAAGEDEDSMAQYVGPIAIPEAGDGRAQIPLPPVMGGAWKREAFLNISNDTDGAVYGLRIAIGNGSGGWSVQKATIRGGYHWSMALPAGTTTVAVSRQALDGSGNAVDPGSAEQATAPYAGPLAASIEYGPVQA